MTAPLRTWLVRKSAWPFRALGEILGPPIEARDRAHADELAAELYARPFVIEPVRPTAVTNFKLRAARRPFFRKTR